MNKGKFVNYEGDDIIEDVFCHDTGLICTVIAHYENEEGSVMLYYVIFPAPLSESHNVAHPVTRYVCQLETADGGFL